MNINETITLTENEGLEIEISRIEFSAAVEDGQTESRPSWLTTQFTAAQLKKQLGSLTFTEDNLEGYVKRWLEYTLGFRVKSFRWIWDKYRTCKAA